MLQTSEWKGYTIETLSEMICIAVNDHSARGGLIMLMNEVKPGQAVRVPGG
jgi:hypothetical protein